MFSVFMFTVPGLNGKNLGTLRVEKASSFTGGSALKIKLLCGCTWLRLGIKVRVMIRIKIKIKDWVIDFMVRIRGYF